MFYSMIFIFAIIQVLKSAVKLTLWHLYPCVLAEDLWSIIKSMQSLKHKFCLPGYVINSAQKNREIFNPFISNFFKISRNFSFPSVPLMGTETSSRFGKASNFSTKFRKSWSWPHFPTRMDLIAPNISLFWYKFELALQNQRALTLKIPTPTGPQILYKA